MSDKKIRVRIEPKYGNDTETATPIVVNDRRYPYSYGQAIELPEEAVEAAEHSDLIVTRLDSDGNDIADDSAASIQPHRDAIASNPPAPLGNAGKGEDGAAVESSGEGSDGGDEGDEDSADERASATMSQTKDELVAIAESEGVQVESDDNKQDLVDKIAKARGE